jgi:acyl dehydratase
LDRDQPGAHSTFADATGDHQWIHLDADRSRKESPFGGTVAHGFLILSLLPFLMEGALVVRGGRMHVNYGLNKVRFPAPVLAGRRVRGRIAPVSVEDIAGGAHITWQITIECEGNDKPVCIAESIVRRYD